MCELITKLALCEPNYQTIMKSYRLNIITILLLLCQFINAQDQLLQTSEQAEAEFHTAINPTDSNNIVVVTMRGFDEVENSYFSIYYTIDFGETWELSDFQGMHDGHVATGDPVIAFNSEGALTLVHLVVTEGDSILTILSESLDKGETWELKYIYEKGSYSDKPWITIDRSESSPYRGNIYVPTVVDAVNLLALDADYSMIYEKNVPSGNHIPCVVTNNDGDIFVSNMLWSSPLEMYVHKYTDGGATLEHSTFVATFPDFTFNLDNISNRFQPSPYIAIDNSNGPFSGRLYMSYTASEQIDLNYFNVFLTYSDDDGQTWSEPKIVHSDKSNFIQQFYSSIYVNDQGVLLLDWYDRSNYDNSNLNTDFFLGISYDGGENFTEVQLNSESMDFAIAADAGFGFGIGEYHQLVATNHTAISFWSDGRTNDGDLNIYFAKASINGVISDVKEQSLINDKISISSIYPQPVQDQINLSIQLDKPIKLKFDIISMDGKVINEGEWTNYGFGAHDINLPINLNAGQYILQAKSDKGYFKNQKFIVLK